MSKSTLRGAFTQTLLELAIQDKDIFALATDSRGSVTLGDFAKEKPEQTDKTAKKDKGAKKQKEESSSPFVNFLRHHVALIIIAFVFVLGLAGFLTACQRRSSANAPSAQQLKEISTRYVFFFHIVLFLLGFPKIS